MTTRLGTAGAVVADDSIADALITAIFLIARWLALEVFQPKKERMPPVKCCTKQNDEGPERLLRCCKCSSCARGRRFTAGRRAGTLRSHKILCCLPLCLCCVLVSCVVLCLPTFQITSNRSQIGVASRSCRNLKRLNLLDLILIPKTGTCLVLNQFGS